MDGVLQHSSFGTPDYGKSSDDGMVREQALADNGDRRRCLPRGAPMHACSSPSLGLLCNATRSGSKA